MLAHDPKPIDQRVIDYKRGYWHGVTVILSHPTRVLRQLTDELEGDEA